MASEQLQRKDSSPSLVDLCYCSLTSTAKCCLTFRWNHEPQFVLNASRPQLHPHFQLSHSLKRFPPSPLISRLKSLLPLSFPLWRGAPVPQAPQWPYAGLSPVHSCLLSGGAGQNWTQYTSSLTSAKCKDHLSAEAFQAARAHCPLTATWLSAYQHS